jgi:tetratricopeptide (TPR) repeat protein
VKIIARVTSWLEAGARIWAAHWLLIIGSFFFCVSLMLRWLNFPLSRSFHAFQLSFSNALEFVPHYHLFSYGVYAAIVFAAGLAARRLSPLALVFAAAILITIWVALPCELAFQQPGVLRRLTTETTDVSVVRSFTRQYLPENYGYVEDIPRHLELGTTLGRVLAAVSFVGLGWACFGVGSLLISFYALTRLPVGTRAVGALCLLLPCVTIAALLIRPMIGQHYFVRARVAQAHGNNELAIADYRRAMWWDRWFAEDINTYAIIGDLQRQSNLAEGSPERHINRAFNLKQNDQYEPAIFELTQAANVGGSLAATVRREVARMKLDFGLALYRAGATGSAVINWEEALAEDPAQIQALVFIARGNYDLARYQEAVKADDKVIESAGLNSVVANAYSLAGDCYTRLGDDIKARYYYGHSIKLDKDINLWATAALTGN